MIRITKFNFKEKYKIGLFVALVFSILYGIFEFVSYDFRSQFDLVVLNGTYNPWNYLYWIFVLVISISVLILFTRDIETSLVSHFTIFMPTEDLFAILLWWTKGNYPFPSINWYNDYFGIGFLGEAIPVFPYFPVWYFVSWCAYLIYVYFRIFRK